VTGRGEHTRPNEVWVADHRIYDVLVANDCFAQADELAAVRLWETCIEDMRTRVIVGSVWSINPSWRTIASALRQGITRFGMPEIFYCDNGKDFRKVGDGAGRGSLLTEADYSAPVELGEDGNIPVEQGLLARLGIKVCYCIPRHPQSKLIESYFNFVSKRFDRMFFGKGYAGSKPDMRPDFCRDAEKQHAQFLAGKREKSPLYGAKHFIELHAQFVDERNREHSHTGRGMKGRAPMDVMDELLPTHERRILDMAALEPLFWDVQKRLVTNCKVHINNSSYSAAVDDLQGQQNMYHANGGDVAVHCDPNDMACALAFEDAPSGALLARLVSDEWASRGRVTQEQVKAIQTQRARLRNASIESFGIIGANVPSEIELLERRGNLPPAVSHVRFPRRVAAVSHEFNEDFVERFRKAE
jgi:putative transposase